MSLVWRSYLAWRVIKPQCAAIPFCQQRRRAPKSSANMQRALFNPMQYDDNNWMAVKIELDSSFYVVTKKYGVQTWGWAEPVPDILQHRFSLLGILVPVSEFSLHLLVPVFGFSVCGPVPKNMQDIHSTQKCLKLVPLNPYLRQLRYWQWRQISFAW